MHSIMFGQLVHSASHDRWIAEGGLEKSVGHAVTSPTSSLLFPHSRFNAVLVSSVVASVAGITVAAMGGVSGMSRLSASFWGKPVLLADLASAFFYTVSRLPQVHLDHRERLCLANRSWAVHQYTPHTCSGRQSGRGLSMGMLSLLAAHNTIYLLTLGARAVAAGGLVATLGEAIWIVQALISVPLDCLMLAQCLWEDREE